MTGPLKALFRRDLMLALRVGGGAMIGVIFFLTVVTIIPFGVGPDMNLLARIGPAILWIGALLATLLGLDRLFQADADDGSLDLLMMSGTPLPLVVAAPVLGLFLNVPPEAMGAVVVTLAAGTPALTCLGTIGAALSVGLRRGGLLMAILILPLTIPVLIFGVAATTAAIVGPLPFGMPFTVLAALSLMSVVLGPVAAAAALRFGLE